MERPIDEKPVEGPPRFRVARNPDAESRLPYLIWLPIEGGLVLKARETWPRASRVFCAQDAIAEGSFPRRTHERPRHRQPAELMGNTSGIFGSRAMSRSA